ncbi:uncharacterized protein KY384_007338 [Bacidia gigantensis]|uniref:uncharacterized protein n=1 Tax=Bacidia gigantensis TaxID=2732470 RepID=UPI001D040BD7|nr:uncharacterized protein KY384_007338 [Bacidia gigantensis]KAG8528420.1 hypothetical protein KY384_007338 [Bacidia gigantensis]
MDRLSMELHLKIITDLCTSEYACCFDLLHLAETSRYFHRLACPIFLKTLCKLLRAKIKPGTWAPKTTSDSRIPQDASVLVRDTLSLIFYRSAFKEIPQLFRPLAVQLTGPKEPLIAYHPDWKGRLFIDIKGPYHPEPPIYACAKDLVACCAEFTLKRDVEGGIVMFSTKQIDKKIEREKQKAKKLAKKERLRGSKRPRKEAKDQ